MQGVHISGLCFDLICRDLGSWVGVEIMLPVADHSPLELSRAILPRVDNGEPRGHARLHAGDCSNISPYRRAGIRRFHVSTVFIKVPDNLCGAVLPSVVTAKVQTRANWAIFIQITYRCLRAISSLAAFVTSRRTNLLRRLLQRLQKNDLGLGDPPLQS
jgi:hypothetical protein